MTTTIHGNNNNDPLLQTIFT